MPHYKDLETMTAEEELRSLLKWAEQTQHENVAAALRRCAGQAETDAANRLKRPRQCSHSTK